MKSQLKRVDSRKTKASEYMELPELTGAMPKRGTVKRAGRPVATNPRRQVTMPVLAEWVIGNDKVISF
ncbi:MAG: hypothetical protein EPN69_08370 [Rhodanobacter sp.]|nr:MAG: hypothetical protein EPN69_08370 [Rhodanobacter sp.]TAM05094.1 MAG: hypothetical protein EPN71_02190 [Rhodanobacter sp.]